MSTVLLPNGPTELNPVDAGDAPSGGTSVDTMVVGVATRDPGAGLGVGDPGLAASADSGGTADVSGAKPPPPLGSSGGIVPGTGTADSIGVGGNATSATLVNQPAITDTSGNGPIGATSNALGTLGPLLPDIALVGGPGPGPGPVAATEIVTFSGSGLTFSNTFEASVSAAVKANILTAEQDIAALWTGSITLNFDFKEAALGTNSFLASNSFSTIGVTYSQLRTALQGKSGDSAIALAAYNSLPTTDPAGGVTYLLPGAYANFLGLSSSTFTDTTTLNSSFSWSFGQDVANTMMHEISEGGMGRVGGLAAFPVGFSTMDLFSYDGSGVRDLSTTDNSRFFSFDGGVTTSKTAGLSYFAANSGNDAADFQQLDVFGTGSPGETNTISQTDINEMDALGWTPACFCRGTLIQTEQGEVAVEELAIGDKVVTLSGALKPIVWIGFGRDLVTRANKLARPVIVRQGALADNVPRRDLYLTHGHALYLDGVLIPVENLVNHRSILWDDTARVVEYYHIELADHDVLLAEGAPAETYYDAGNRALFHNPREGSAAGAEKPTCAPVLNAGEVVGRVWAALFERAGGQIEGDTTDDPDLHLVIAGERLDPTALADGVYTFALAGPPAGTLLLSSRSAVPSLLGLSRHEHRRLGVAIRQIILHRAGIMTCFDHDAPLFGEGGCHLLEGGHCWTDGELYLPASLFAHLTGAFALIVHTRRQAMRYPVAPAIAEAA